jgi:hypothetical protein
MARPLYHKVDFFPHDVVHRKTMFTIEAQFGNDGYAFWFKLLETLGATDDHYYDCNKPDDWQYLVAMTKVSEETANAILESLSVLGAIDSELWKKRVIWSQNFVDRLRPLYDRRKGNLPTRPIVKGDNGNQKHGLNGVTDDINPQSKVKESKVKKSKVKESKRILFSQTEKRFESVDAEMMNFFISKFPAVNVQEELLKMEAWIVANPKNKKSNYERFIVNWLTKAQDKAKPMGGGSSVGKYSAGAMEWYRQQQEKEAGDGTG